MAPPPLPYPNETLPLLQMTLEEFVTKATVILQDSDDIYDFCRMVLAGRLQVNGVEHRIFINARQNLPPIHPRDLTLTRDYDSICALSSDLPYSVPFSVYPVAPFRDTLTSDNFLKGKAYDKEVSGNQRPNQQNVKIISKGNSTLVPMYKIPNLALGKVSGRHVTRMMFPRLYDEGNQDRTIAAYNLSRIYDEGIRPAVEAICNPRLSHWPASYSSAITKAKDKSGKLHFGTVDLSVDLLPEFAQRLKENLDRIPKLKDMYFMHEVRGTKGATVHNPDTPEACWRSLEDQLEFLDLTTVNPRNWYIDVGLEVHLPGHVLQWLEDAHLRLLKFGLPTQAENLPESLSTLLNDRRNFKLDRVAQFKEFAGFRCTPCTRGQSDDIAYLNVYTTDKEPTYQLHSGSFRKHLASELLPFKSNKILNDVTAMSKVYGQCMGSEGRTPNEGCARFEVRVGLEHAADAVSTMSSITMRGSLVAIPVNLWW